ncbi:MAG: hypothetical protein ACI4VX_02955 [Succinivibrionaceae bacterium]
MLYVDTAQQQAETFFRTNPEIPTIMALKNELKSRYVTFDRGNSEYTVYTADTILMVVLWSSLCGGKPVKTMHDHKPILQYIIPVMPSPRWMISPKTIHFFLKLIPEERFNQYSEIFLVKQKSR